MDRHYAVREFERYRPTRIMIVRNARRTRKRINSETRCTNADSRHALESIYNRSCARYGGVRGGPQIRLTGAGVVLIRRAAADQKDLGMGRAMRDKYDMKDAEVVLDKRAGPQRNGRMTSGTG